MSIIWPLIEGIFAGIGALFTTIIVGGIFARHHIHRKP